MGEPINAGDVVDRLRVLYGVVTDQGLSEAIDVPKTTISSWRSRHRAPYDICVDAVLKYRSSLDWVIFGTGSPRRVGDDERGHYDAGDPGDERMQRITAFLRHWAATRSDDDQAWLEMQLARAVPEYAEWLAGQGKR